MRLLIYQYLSGASAKRISESFEVFNVQAKEAREENKSTYWKQGCHILEKSWKVLDFFCCPGKSLKVLEFCLLVLESPGKIFIKFSRNLPGHKVKFVFFMITGTLQLYKAIVEKISVVKFVQKALLYC